MIEFYTYLCDCSYAKLQIAEEAKVNDLKWKGGGDGNNRDGFGERKKKGFGIRENQSISTSDSVLDYMVEKNVLHNNHNNVDRHVVSIQER